MNKRTMLVLFTCVLMLALVVLAACTQTGGTTQSAASSAVTSEEPEAAASSEEGTATATEASAEAEAPIRSDAWRATYPYIFDSMAEGAAENKDGENRPHTHNQENLIQATENYLIDNPEWYDNGLNTAGTAYCISCRHASDFKTLYDEDPQGVWGLSYQDVIDRIGVNDQWGCYQCHGNNPGVEVDTHNELWLQLAGSFADTLTGDQRACGQCHTAMYNYFGNGANIDFNNTDGYKYGTDPIGLRNAYIEQGGSVSVDEETGIETYDTVYGDLEMLQDGVHSNAGLTCESCHMPVVERDGETFRSHNASGSPLKSEEALQTCLTCHSSAGSTEGMVEVVRNKQAEIRALDEELVAKMDTLAGLIVAGGADDVIATAKANYLDASTYRNFCKAYATDVEIKVAHNPGKFDEYMKTAIELVDEGIAALS